MNYQETLEFLFTSAPLFQNIGAGAYKEGLSTTEVFDEHFGHPHRSYRTIHVGGTNGKGSTSHTLAAILQSAGYRVGLYTSPHLVDFRERIRVDGCPISEQRVIDFVVQEREFFEPHHPSFFELTTALAFKYFEEQKVDIAVVEVGLGGRLDCTNIIRPVLSVITNISLDHTQFLGDTLPKIAGEKAGIIKKGVPTVIGQALPETRPVFVQKARDVETSLFFAEDESLIRSVSTKEGRMVYSTDRYGEIVAELSGWCQVKNTGTVLSALKHLPTDIQERLTPEAVRQGFKRVVDLTGLLGRWQRVRIDPMVVCDTGHNADAWEFLSLQLEALPCRRLHIVFGASSDKDVCKILRKLPEKSVLYFTQASVQRALPVAELVQQAAEIGRQGASYSTVQAAYAAALATASADDAVFVGGSSFVVADFLASQHLLPPSA